MSSASLLPLLRMSIAAQTEAAPAAAAPAAPAEEVKPMSKEDQAWLQAAMTELTKNPVDEMKKLVAQLRDPERSPDEQVDTLQALIGFVEHIDLARDLHKINGLEVVIALIQSSPHSKVRAAACEVLATTTANNPEPQQRAMEFRALAVLAKVLATDEPGATTTVVEKSKAIFAISSIVRQNDAGYVEFVNKQNGFRLLHAVLTTHSDKDALPARRKAVFLLLYLFTRAPVTCKPMAPSFVPVLRACLEADKDDEAFVEQAQEVLQLLMNV